MSLHGSRIAVYGFLIYSAVFMLWAFLYAYGIASVIVYGQTASILNYIVVSAAVFLATRHIGISSLKDALVYGAGWAVIHALLDYIYITPAAGFDALLVPSIWVNYGLVLAIPLTVVLYQQAARKVSRTTHGTTVTYTQ